ncbi:hypothetical protein Tco_1086991 [Tanacetum coccineum]
MESMNDPEEFYDALFCLRDDKRVEYNTLMAVNDVIAKAEEKLTTKEAHLEIIEVWLLHYDNSDDMPIMDEVVFKIHKNRYFEFDPLRFEVNHTDNDVHSLFVDAERNEEDAALRCSSSSPFSTMIKRKGGRKSIQTSHKGKDIMYEFIGPSPTKESQVSVTNYKRAIVNGKAKMVEVEAVGLVQPVGSTTKVQRSTAKDVPRHFIKCILEEGLTIIEGDGDMNKLYDIAEKYGLINLYIAHLPKNLAEYYFKILTLDASNEEVKSKLKSHEKRKLDACSMSPHELVEWEQKEAGSPYLRTPPLKPRRKADELVLHDDWQYEGFDVDDVGGSSKHCDLLHENVIYNGHSLLNMDKERFSNNVVLDDVVTDTLAYTLPLVLKKKRRNKVNVTRKTRCLNNSNTMRLRKGCGKRVAIGGHGRGLGRLIGLNVATVDDDPQVTKQVSLPARSSNTEVKDLE